MSVTALGGTAPFPTLDMPELVEAGRHFTRAQNLAAVDRLDAVFSMLCAAERQIAAEEAAASAEGCAPRPEYARLTPERLVRGHVGTAFGATHWHAGRLVDAAVQLHTRLRRLNRAAREGLIDEALIVDLACRLRDVPDHLVADVEDEVVASVMAEASRGDTPSRNSLGERIDRAMESLDPEETDRRHEQARQQRRVSFRPKGLGMTSLWAMLPTEDAAALHERLRTVAGRAPSDDPRTSDELMADALVALGTRVDTAAGTGTDAATVSAGESDLPAETPANRSAPVGKLEITVIAAAALGLPARVEFVRGAYSSFDWLCGQVLAEENGGARFRLIDPLPGAQDDPDDALKYVVSAEMARRIRLRDRTCRHPGCSVPADRCELDHVIAFNRDHPARGGPTAEWNLVCLCKEHHQLKTFGPWIYRSGALGELIITTETGHEYRTYPDGMLARARDDLLDVARRRWHDRNRPHDP